MHYSTIRKQIILKDDILYRQYYNKVDEINHPQVLLLVQLLETLLNSLHGTTSKHPGISQMMQEIRRKYYFPSITKYVLNWVQQSETCITDKRINNINLRPDLLIVLEWKMGPEDAMQIDLLRELPTSEQSHSNRRNFQIRFCIPSLYPHCSKYSKSHQ